jgi:hypothetical protein
MPDSRVSIALVVLVALAGCGGVSLTDGSGTDGDAPSLEAQSWTEGESIAFETLFERHDAVIENASSFERTRNVSTSTGASTTVLLGVDRDESTLFLDIASGDGDQTQIQETYVADGTLYAKSGTASNPEYSEQSFDSSFAGFVTEQASLGIDPEAASQFDWTYDGFEDGAYQFTADGVNADADVPVTGIDVTQATDVSATLRVDERGFVGRLTVEATLPSDGEDVSFTAVIAYSGVNETTVEEPDWLSKA